MQTAAERGFSPVEDEIYWTLGDRLRIQAALSTRDLRASAGHAFIGACAEGSASPLQPKDKKALASLEQGDLDSAQLLSTAAAEIFRMRRARDHVMPKGLIGEPAWDMLLALYSEEPAKLTVSSVCYGSGVPQSTAMRWIAILERQKLVRRVQHPRDERIILLSLAEDGRLLVERALKAMLRVFRG